jgi:hypothetical protein
LIRHEPDPTIMKRSTAPHHLQDYDIPSDVIGLDPGLLDQPE